VPAKAVWRDGRRAAQTWPSWPTNNKPIRTVDDLRGKKLGVTTVGSLTDWIGQADQRAERAGPRTASPRFRSAACSRRAPRSRPASSMAISVRSKPATNSKKTRSGASSPRRRPMSTTLSPTCSRPRGSHREAPEAVRAFLKGWIDTIAFHEGEQGQDRGDHLQGDQCQPVGREPRL